jgi:signal peptidase I
MRFFEKRRLKKKAHAILQGIQLARNMREDIAPRDALDRLAAAEQAVRDASKNGNKSAFEKAAHTATDAAHDVYPPARHPVVREWVELIVVALAVAMGFRTYLLQPFKIPTGSMQPTLYGIYFKPDTAPPAFRTFIPLRYLRQVVTGEIPFEIRAQSGGRIYQDPTYPERQTDLRWGIDRQVYMVPKDLTRHAKPGDIVVPGQLLASGLRVAGDHLFVNRMAWNFRRPRVGEVMVFSTEAMLDVTPDTHYIKRLTGRPLDKLRIDSPMLFVNGEPMDQNPGMKKVVTCTPGYAYGYQNATLLPDIQYMRTSNDVYQVPARHYFGMGDNTMNSRDSRYFGPIPEEKLMGPAFFVYWPISKRFGLIH